MFFEELIAKRAVLIGVICPGSGLNLPHWEDEARKQGLYCHKQVCGTIGLYRLLSKTK